MYETDQAKRSFAAATLKDGPNERVRWWDRERQNRDGAKNSGTNDETQYG